LRNPTTTF
jgi:hypothetical protein